MTGQTWRGDTILSWRVAQWIAIDEETEEDKPGSFLTGGEVKRDPVEEVRHNEASRAAVHEEDLHQVPDQLKFVHQLGLQ